MNTYVCDSCNAIVAVGEWPFCPHGHPSGQLSSFKERWDECVAPPPGEDFKPSVPMPDYDPKRGWRVTTYAEQKRLMKLAHTEYRN